MKIQNPIHYGQWSTPSHPALKRNLYNIFFHLFFIFQNNTNFPYLSHPRSLPSLSLLYLPASPPQPAPHTFTHSKPTHSHCIYSLPHSQNTHHTDPHRAIFNLIAHCQLTMNSRTRRQSPRSESLSYLRYLKPGALARLRDSRISAHRTLHPVDCKPNQISSPPRAATPSQIGPVDGPPSPGRIYGPRCPQRKKIMAAKSFLYASPSLTGHGPEASPIVDLFSGSGDSAIVVAQ